MPTLKERAPLTTQEILQEAAIGKNACGIPEGALLGITGGSPPGTEELAGTTSLPRTPNTNTGPPTGTSMALTLATLLADSTAQTTPNPHLPPPHLHAVADLPPSARTASVLVLWVPSPRRPAAGKP